MVKRRSGYDKQVERGGMFQQNHNDCAAVFGMLQKDTKFYNFLLNQQPVNLRILFLKSQGQVECDI